MANIKNSVLFFALTFDARQVPMLTDRDHARDYSLMLIRYNLCDSVIINGIINKKN